jgi:hypothetical protein
MAVWTAVPLGRPGRRLILRRVDPFVVSFERVGPKVLSLGAKVQAIATEAVGPFYSSASPLWTLQWLRFGPDVAAAFADCVENRDPGQQR